MLAIGDWIVEQLDRIIPILAIVGLAAALIVAVVGATVVVQSTSCRAKAEAMGVNWSYDVWQECMIVVDGKNVPLSAYQVVKVTQ